MITQDEAAQIAERIAGAPADDPAKGWTLEEFDHGWLLYEKAMVGLMGPGPRVVEKESGRVMGFGSAIRVRLDPSLAHSRRREMIAKMVVIAAVSAIISVCEPFGRRAAGAGCGSICARSVRQGRWSSFLEDLGVKSTSQCGLRAKIF